MKFLCFAVVTLMMTAIGCKTSTRSEIPAPNDGNSTMLADSSSVSDKEITMVQAKDTIRIGESMNKFEDYPNITQTDIDAGKMVESKEIHFVKKGETLRLAEPGSKRE